LSNQEHLLSWLIWLPFPARLLLARLLDHDETTLATGNSAINSDQVAFRIHHDDFHVLHSDAVHTHVTSTARAFVNAARRGAGSARTGGTVAVGSTMCGVHAMEVIALHASGKALAFADADHIHTLADDEGISNRHLITDLQAVLLGTELAQDAHGGNLIGFQVTQ